MKYIFIFITCCLTSFAISAPLTDSLRIDIAVNGSTAPTVEVCYGLQPISIVGTIQTTTGGAYTGFLDWSTTGTGDFANAGTPSTTYTPTNADLAAGSVKLILQPDCVCFFVPDTVTIAFLAAITITNVATSDVTICGGSNGRIIIDINGGTPPYLITYNRAGGANVQISASPNAANQLIINGLIDGAYSISSITDGRGCGAIGSGIGASYSIGKPSSPSLGSGGITVIPSNSCRTCNGSISIPIQNGTPPFSLQIDSAGFIRSRNNISLDANNRLIINSLCGATIQNIRITDANTCTMANLVGPFFINEPQRPLLGLDGVQTANPSSCNNSICDGSLAVRIAAAQPGTAPYTMLFDSSGVTNIRRQNLPLNSSNQVLIAALCADIYRNVRIEDANECSLIVPIPLAGPFTLVQPSAPLIDTVRVVQNCNVNIGNIKILLNTMQLGASPYRIVIGNANDSLIYNNVPAVGNSIDLGNIPPNLYTWLKITDSRGCFSIYPQAIRIYNALSATLSAQSCAPLASLTAAAQGNGSLLYRWNTNANTAAITNQNAGIYTVTITDLTTACTLSASAAINPCSAIINTSLLLRDSVIICLPIGDLPQPATSLTMCNAPNSGIVRVLSPSCVQFVSSNNFVGTAQFCLLQCNTTTLLCDTTFVNINIYYTSPGSTTVLDTVGIGASQSFCPPTNMLNAPPYMVRQICTNTQPNLTLQIINNCLFYTGVNVGTDTTCVVICDALGACDTTMLYISSFAKPRSYDDSVTVPVQTLTIIDILENDQLAGIPVTQVRLLNGTQDGTMQVSSDFKISFKSSANICRDLLPIFCEICTAAGCDTTMLRIKVICETEKPVVVYTFMSPNNDGYNDEFRIDGLQKYSNSLLSIYDRWGSLVYAQTNYKNDWQGMMNNAMLPDGTYFYVLELNDGDKTIKKGYFQMAR